MQRRAFMKGAVLAAVAGSSARVVFGQNAPSNRVRVALMGCHAKGRGFQLMKAVAGLPGVEIATVCDVDSRAREEAAAEITARTQRTPKKETDIRKVLEEFVAAGAPDRASARIRSESLEAIFQIVSGIGAPSPPSRYSRSAA